MDDELSAMMGRLSLRVVHQLNNLLGVVHANAEMLEREPELAELLGDAIRRAAGQGGRLTRQLMTLAEPRASRERLELVEFMPGSRELLEAMLGPRIGLHVVVDGDAGAVEAAPGGLLMALLQLVLEAGEAVAGDGIRGGPLGDVRLLARAARSEDRDGVSLEAGDFVAILVAHDGPGVGTECGAAAVRAFCEQTGGAVWRRATAGFGAACAMLLPQAPAASATLPARGAAR